MNTNGILALLINKRLATLRELEEYYSWPDALNLYEVVMVQAYNDWVTQENARKKR